MDMQEVEKYRPIPWEGVRLLAWVALAALVALGGAFFLGMIFPEASLSLEFWKGWMILFVIALTVLFRLGARRINGYWERNVRGYTLWGWRDFQGEVKWEIALILPYDLAIGVALGGWFRRSRIICSAVTFCEGVDSKKMLSRWRVNFVQIHANTGAIIVRLTDRYGNRVTVNAKDALEILERFSARLEAFTNTWDAVVSHGFIVEHVLTKERDEARQQLKDAIAQIVGTVDHLDATKRFIKSKQAQEIRRGLVCELERLLPQYDPRREKYGLSVTTRCATDSQPAAVEAQAGG